MTKEELEEEAKEYAIGLTYPKFQDIQIANYVLRDVEGAYIMGAEPREKRIAELEKENATLKQNKETVAHLGNICIEVAKQMLEEAVELLKEWIVCHGGTRKFHSALQDKTETFLKECEA